MNAWDWEEGAYCDGCHKSCHLSAPRCNYGRQQAREVAAEREAAYAQAPTCPGCHVGCSLAKPSCGRCRSFLDQWKNGEQVTTREEVMKHMRAGRPRGGRPGPGGLNAPVASKLAMTIPIGAHMLEGASLPFAEGRFLNMLHHAMGDWVRYSVLEEKSRMDAKNLYPMIDALLEKGCLIREFDVLYITEAGVQTAADFQEHEAENNAHFFEALTDEELETFSQLWEKLMHSWAEMSGRHPR